MSALDPAATPVKPRAERRLDRLERLSDKGLAMVEALPNDGAAESADSYVKLARSLRLSATLEAKLDGDLPVGPGGSGGRAAAPDPYAALTTGKRGRVRELVVDVADHNDPNQANFRRLRLIDRNLMPSVIAFCATAPGVRRSFCAA